MTTPARSCRSALDEIVLEGARRMLAAALEAEVDAYVDALAGRASTSAGRRLVVRNGHAEPRTITTGAGPVEIEAPRVNDRRVDDGPVSGAGSAAAIVPPWCRKRPEGRRGAAVDVPARHELAATSPRRSTGSSAPRPGCRRR